MNVKIQEVKSTTKTHHINCYTHINGLGLDKDGKPIEIACGLVGQMDAHQACGLIVELKNQKKWLVELYF